MRFKKIISLALAATMLSPSIARAKDFNTPEGIINTGGSMQSQAVVEKKSPELELRITNIQSRLVSVLDSKSNVATAAWSKVFVTNPDKSTVANCVGLSRGQCRVNYVLANVAATSLDNEQQKRIQEACEKVRSGKANDQDFVIVHLANVLIQLVKDNGVLPDEIRYTQALAAVTDTVIATPTPSKTTLDSASVLGSEISAVILGEKTTSAPNIDLLLGQLKEIEGSDVKSKLLQYLRKAYDGLHKYGFGNYVPGTDASGQLVVTYESLLDALIVAWNEAKAFRISVQEQLLRMGPDQMASFIDSIPKERVPVVISLINKYFVGMGIIEESKALPNEKEEAISQLKNLGKRLVKESSAGQTEWSEFQKEYRETYYPQISALEQRYFDSLSVLPFFSAVLFHRSYQELNDTSEGLITRDAKFAIFNSAIKLHALTKDTRVLDVYFRYALPEIAKRCGASNKIFEEAVMHIDRKLDHVINPEKLESVPFIDRSLFAFRLAEAFYRFNEIPLNVLAKFDQRSLASTYVKQEPISHQFMLNPLGFMPAGVDFSPWGTPQIRIPRNFNYAEANQSVFELSGGFGSEGGQIIPVNVKLVSATTFAEQQVGAARSSLYSGFIPNQLSPYPSDSLMTGYTSSELLREIDVAFVPNLEPQYSGKVIGGGAAGGAKFGDKSPTIGGFVGGLLFLQGAVGVSGINQDSPTSSSSGYTLTAAQVPLPLGVRDTGLFFNIHGAGVALNERESGSDQSGLSAKQKQMLIDWYTSVAIKRKDGSLQEPGEFLVKVWSLEDEYPVTEGSSSGSTGNKRLKVDTIYVGKDNQVYLYYGSDSVIPPYNHAGGLISTDPVTFGLTMVAPGREPFFEENLLMQFPEYKQELVLLRKKYPNWNSEGDDFKQVRDDYKKEHSTLVKRYREDLAVNGGGVLAVNLPEGWAVALMGSAVAGPKGETSSGQWVGAASKTWQETVISPWQNGTATLMFGFPGMLLDPTAKNPRPVQSVHVAWREVGGQENVKNGIPEAWQVDIMAGGMKSPAGSKDFLGGLQVKYQDPGATMRMGFSAAYSRADAFYQGLLAVNPGSSSTQVGGKNKSITLDASQLVSDYEDKFRYMHRFYSRAYYADQFGGLMLGLLGSMLVEWKDRLENASTEEEKTQVYWNILATLAAANKVFGIQFYSKRYSSGQVALSELKSAIARVSANPALMGSVLTPKLEPDFNLFFQEYGLRMQVMERGSLDLSIVGKEETTNQYSLAQVDQVRGKATWNFDDGFIRVAGQYPVGTKKDPKTGDNQKIGWFSIGGGATLHAGPWAHRFALDLLFLPTNLSAEESFKPRGGQATLALYEDIYYQWYLIGSAVFPDWDKDKAKLDIGTMVEISNKGSFYLIYDHSAGNIFVTTEDKKARQAIFAGASVTLYKRGNTEINLDAILAMPIKENPTPAAASTLNVRIGNWSILLGGSLMSKDAYGLSPMDTWQFTTPGFPGMSGSWAAGVGAVLTYSWGAGAPSISVPYLPTPLERGGTGRSPHE